MKKSGANRIKYDERVLSKDLPRIDNSVKQRIKVAIEDKLVIYPEIYGKPLRGILKGYWSLRVGDWRIVYTIKKEVIFILAVRHRGEIYTVSTNRS